MEAWAKLLLLACLAFATAVTARPVDLQQVVGEDANVGEGLALSSLEREFPVALGLSFGFYSKSCPQAESTITRLMNDAVKRDAGIAPGLLRIFFHDCFSQGCDGSILLSDSRGSELNDPANGSIRRSALTLIDQIKAALESTCRGVVSCADIIVAATRDSIRATQGPAFNVQLGRLDSFTRFSTASLPGPTASFADQLTRFSSFGLNTNDLVALATGSHTLGVAQCASFQQRLRPTVDPKLNGSLAQVLLRTCQSPATTVPIDFFSPSRFDNEIYKNFLTGGAILQSDQNMDSNAQALGLVRSFAGNLQAFFNQFTTSFLKMSQIRPLSGKNGEIRRVCSRSNGAGLPSVDGGLDEAMVIKQVTDDVAV